MSASVAYGQIDITADAEGFDCQEDPGFHYGFGILSNPRSLAGVRADGTLLLVTVEGSGPGYSFGESLLTLPTDDTGERPIGDAIVVLDCGNLEPLPQTGGDSLFSERGGLLRWLRPISGFEGKGAY